MRTLAKLLTGVGLAVVLAVGGFVQPAHAYPPNCVGPSFSGYLHRGDAICEGDYLVRHQTNGDLVMRHIPSGAALWTSGTRASDSIVTFDPGNLLVQPSVIIQSPTKGGLARIWGRHGATSQGTNANVNMQGGFWIGYKRIR